MRSSLVAITLVLLLSPAASAAPGDPRVIEGTLEWPATLGTQPFAVIRADDTRHYYADVSSVVRATVGPVNAGERLALGGVEGSHPHEIAVLEIGAPGSVARTGTPAKPTTAPSASVSTTGTQPATAVAPPSDAAAELWRLQATVVSTGARTVTVRTHDGTDHVVDVSALTATTLKALRAGDVITLYGEPQADRRLVAIGLVQVSAVPGSASPATR